MSLQLFQMATEPHTDWEIAIERELHGALPEAEARTLADHLAGCTACRTYQRITAEMETTMTSMTQLASFSHLTDTLRDKVRVGIGRQLRYMGAVIALSFICAVLMNAGSNHSSFDSVSCIVLAIVGFVAGIYRVKAERRLTTTATGDLFVQARKQLETELQLQKTILWPSAILAVSVAAMEITIRAITHQPFKPFLTPLVVIIFGGAAIAAAVLRTKTRRQLAAIG